MVKVFAVVLESNRFIILPENWIKKPIEGEYSVAFYSEEVTDEPNFGLERKFYFDGTNPNCYSIYVAKYFEKIENAQAYIQKKRPIYAKRKLFKKFDVATVVDSINVSVSFFESFLLVQLHTILHYMYVFVCVIGFR